VAKPPKKTTTAGREARRTRIAASVVQGKTAFQIAAEESISRSWASKEANAPSTRLAIAALLDRHRDVVEPLITEALTVIKQSLSAAQFSVQKITTIDLIEKVRRDEIRIVEVGPDHYARLTGAKRLIELLLAGRPAIKQEEDSPGLCTLDQLQAALRSVPKDGSVQ
jgi:hypothetical protein